MAKLFEAALEATVPNVPDVKPLVAACTAKFGDYQWYGTHLRMKNICELYLWNLPRVLEMHLNIGFRFPIVFLSANQGILSSLK